jgi:hypothetical protein
MLDSLLRLLCRTALQTLDGMGTSLLAVLIGVVAHGLNAHPWKQGWKDRMIGHWGIGTLFVLGSWLCLFGWTLANSVYEDHLASMARNASLVSEREALASQNAALIAERDKLRLQISRAVPRQDPQLENRRKEIRLQLYPLQQRGGYMRDQWLRLSANGPTPVSAANAASQRDVASQVTLWLAEVRAYLLTVPNGPAPPYQLGGPLRTFYLPAGLACCREEFIDLVETLDRLIIISSDPNLGVL